MSEKQEPLGDQVEGDSPEAASSVEPVLQPQVEPVVQPHAPQVVAEELASLAEPPRRVAGRTVEYPCVPEEPDPPSYAPIITGLGIAVSAWGFLTSPTILALGFFTFVYGMSIWIKELTHHEP